MSGRVLFYVQHLMGVGHVFRAMRIVKAIAAAGHRVDLVYGGEPIPNFDAGKARTHFLPPLRAGSLKFNLMEMPDGTAAGEDYRKDRRDRLLAVLRDSQPDMIVTEAFPFGRRQMRFELLPLLDAAKAMARPPAIAASIRDILQEGRRPDRDMETADYLDAYYDHVFVHGDPGLVRLDTTYPHAGRVRDRILYTGIVAPETTGNASRPDATREVIVSVGGGLLGRELLFAAAGAKALSSLRDARWCIVTGINTAPEDVAHLKTLISSNTEIVTFLPDLRDAIAQSRLSISRAGYNTVADICRADCRAVVVPLSDGEETEQIRRVEMLTRLGLAETVPHDTQTPEALAAAIDRAMAAPVPDRTTIDLDGAARTARIVSDILAGETPRGL